MTKSRAQMLILSAVSAGVAIIMLSYSAFAWFTLLKEVRAESMDIEIGAVNDLQISLDNSEWYNDVRVDLKKYVEELTLGQEHEFDSETDTFSLLPASSYDGLNIWKTERAGVNGAALCNADEFERGHAVTYSTQYNVYDGHYIDVPLYLRTSSSQNRAVAISKNTIGTTTDPAFNGVVRIAFLNGNATAPASSINSAPYDKTLVYADETKSQTGEVVTLNPDTNKSKLVTRQYLTYSNTSTKSGLYLSNQTICTAPAMDYATGTYHSIKITLRIWIEGQDRNCTPAIGTQTFRINAVFALKD